MNLFSALQRDKERREQREEFVGVFVYIAAVRVGRSLFRLPSPDFWLGKQVPALPGLIFSNWLGFTLTGCALDLNVLDYLFAGTTGLLIPGRASSS